MNNWLVFVTSLPTENATARMRAWRALKACGSAVLRDGVYLLPTREACSEALAVIATDIRAHDGIAYLLEAGGPDSADFPAYFDRTADYAELMAEIATLRAALTGADGAEVQKRLRKLHKALAMIVEIDFFPGEAQKQATTALQDLAADVGRWLSPGEPRAVDGQLPRLQIAAYRGRTWATRQRPWVDRLACAWLIQRFIDPQARLLWLATPADCPADALGFDFDGAAFSHVGGRVTFETLLASFGLDDAALARLGAVVHFLDVGGVQPPEAAGVERVLAGLCDALDDDDQLLNQAGTVFDGLLAAFRTDASNS